MIPKTIIAVAFFLAYNYVSAQRSKVTIRVLDKESGQVIMEEVLIDILAEEFGPTDTVVTKMGGEESVTFSYETKKMRFLEIREPSHATEIIEITENQDLSQLDVAVRSLGDIAFIKNFPTIYFESSSFELTSENKAILDDLAVQLKQIDSLNVLIAGHADPTGNMELNNVLSMKRAEAVQAYLVAQGVNPDILKSEGLGESQLLTNPEEIELKHLNRRVEFKIEQ